MSSIEMRQAGVDCGPVSAIQPYLAADDDVLRCAAARALGALGDPGSVPALLEALLDEDPDARTDAMAALVGVARPQVADPIRRSLLGDPVREVKVSAIQALARVQDRDSVPLLRALAKDRCADDVAWDDEDGGWDDWLDVQVAAIEALGEMGAGDAIADLLEVRADELGQNLDHVVFNALARIPDGGIAALLDQLRDRSARVRERALAALARAAPETLAPLRDLIVRDADPNVRRLAAACFDSGSPMVADLALRDPAPSVRQAMLAAVAATRPDIAKAALSDPDEEALAIALEALVANAEPSDVPDLAANAEAWAQTGGARLAASCATLLPRIVGVDAESALCAIAMSEDRPQEARIAALGSLGEIGSEVGLATLRAAAIDPVAPVRLSALASIARVASSPEAPCRQDALDVLLRAAQGELLEPSPSSGAEGIAESSSAGASKVEEAASGRIRITREGEIVSAEEPASPSGDALASEADTSVASFPRSTLEAIQAPPTVLSEAADAALSDDDLARLSESRPQGGRRRVAVDGPDDVGTDVRLMALRVVADCPGPEIDNVLAEAIAMAPPPVRGAALAATARRSEEMPLAPVLLERVAQALEDPDPRLRGQAAIAVAKRSPRAADELAALLDDPDAIVRAVALKAVAARDPARALPGLRDDSSLVRKAAVESLLERTDAGRLEEAVRISLEATRADSLAEASRRSPVARGILISLLAGGDLPRGQALAALEAVALAGPPGGR